MAERTSGAPTSDKDIKGILGLKISKRSYIFNIKRPFEYVRQFKVEKRSEGIEQFKRLASASIQALMKTSMKTSPKIHSVRAIPRSPFISKILLIIVAILIIFLVAIGAYLMFLISTAPLILPPAEPSGSRIYLASAYSDKVLYGQDEASVGLAAVRLDAENISSANITLSMYAFPVAHRVIMVNLGNQQDPFTSEFASNLSALLQADGSELETIDLAQLKHQPPALAVYVVPSEYILASFVGKEAGQDLLTLTKNGGVVMFAGFDFTKALVKTGESDRIIDVPADELRAKYGLSFSSPREQQFSNELGMAVKAPLYGANGGSGSYEIYGGVLVASFESWNNTGKLVLIPQTLKKGWNNSASAAANAFFKLIRRVSWNKPIASGNTYISPPNQSAVFSLVTAPSKALSSLAPYPYILAEVVDKSNRSYMQSVVRPQIYKSTEPLGKLHHNPVALPTALSGRPLPIRGTDLTDKPTRMELSAFYNDNRVSAITIGSYSANLQYDYAITLAPGDYVLVLSNADRGTVYAKSYLRVPVLTLVPEFYGWDSGTFGFALLQDGVLMSPETTVSGIRVSMDGGPTSTVAAEEGKLIFRSPDAPVSAGTHTFKFEFGTNTQTITETFTPSRNWWDETQYRLAMLAVLCIFLLGYLLRRPDIELYGLDVPDFPPLSKLAIPIKRPAVLGIFEAVSKEYKWNYMPLKINEIKSGFRKILHQGKGILIGDYNTERIMETLLLEGYVKKLLGLYAPANWEAGSSHVIRYLAIFRLMRDVLVNNAIRFTDLNSSKEYDSMIGLGETGAMVQIYEPSAIGRILSGAQDRPQLLLFANDSEKVNFEESLDSTSKARVILKMLLSSGRLWLVAVDELETFIKKAAPH